MKPLGKDERPHEPIELRATTLTSSLYSKMTLLSFIMSFVTLCAVMYSFYAIPAAVEQKRAGRMEELRAITSLVEEVDDLTESVVELTNAGSNSGRNPR